MKSLATGDIILERHGLQYGFEPLRYVQINATQPAGVHSNAAYNNHRQENINIGLRLQVVFV